MPKLLYGLMNREITLPVKLAHQDESYEWENDKTNWKLDINNLIKYYLSKVDNWKANLD